MLTASFTCFRGLSPAAERRLWEAGCLNWRTFHAASPSLLSERKRAAIGAEMLQAEAALEAELPDFFLNRLPAADKIRVLHEFQNTTAFVDIETTGLRPADRITTIAVLKNGHLSVFVKDRDLHRFLGELRGVRLLATYNGTRFDLPFIRKEFGIDLAIPHLDLMPVLAAHGYRGGQKQCEQTAGLRRQFSEGTDGAQAVNLWNRFVNDNSEAALDELKTYNAEDVVMLEKLACLAYRRSMQTFPLRLDIKPKFPGLPEPATEKPKISAL